MKALISAALTLVLLIASAPAGAGTDNAGDMAARKAMALDMLAACNMRAEIEAYFEKLAESQAAEARDQYRQLSDEQWSRFTAAFKANLRGFVDKYIEFAATVDAAHLSESDMKELTDFCRTPTGQKVAAIRAQIERETFELRGAFLKNALIAAGTDALQQVQTEVPGGHL
jgi:DNA repair photolyase